MKIKIDFFQSDNSFLDAIGAGVYEVEICTKDGEKSVYIGESVFVLVRCATHLYELERNSVYWGFKPEWLNDPNITLKFKLHKLDDGKDKNKKADRKIYETYLIKKNQPTSQSGIADRQKSIEDRISALAEFLEKQED